MTVDKKNITFGREDFSRFVVHLTRNDRKDFKNHGSTGAENLNEILSSKQVLALRTHCLHKHRLEELDVPDEILEQFKVACFTEVPLSQIHLLTQPIDGVAYQREAYGIVFDRSLLIQKGAQPAIYVNSYDGLKEVCRAFDRVLANAVNRNWSDDSWKMLPFVNAMHERYDFTWEREWRTNFAFEFSTSDVVAIILPPTGDDKIRKKAVRLGIPCISPGWTYEMIVSELSKQQRQTRRSVQATQAVKKGP